MVDSRLKSQNLMEVLCHLILMPEKDIEHEYFDDAKLPMSDEESDIIYTDSFDDWKYSFIMKIYNFQ